MKTHTLTSKAFAIGLLALAGISSPLTSSAHGSNGFLEFLTGNGRAVNVPIETVSGQGGQISYAQIREKNGRYVISGSVRRNPTSNPAPGSHVDISMTDANQKSLTSFTVGYLPRPIPHQVRGIPAHSTFSASLNTLPTDVAGIKVIFHNGPREGCGQ